MSKFIKNKPEDLSYRQSVYAYIINDKQELLLVHKRNSNRWDFPGGGVDENESFTDAIKRELSEELGVSSFEIIMKSKFTYKYDWPESEIEKNFKKSGTWKRGQEQHFFVVHFKENTCIKLQEEELIDYKWIPYNRINEHMSYNDQFEHLTKVFYELGVILPVQI